MDVVAVASAMGQIASAALTIPAVFVAYFAYKTSRHSAEATAALTNIERMRLHAELRPLINARAYIGRYGEEPEKPESLALVLDLVGPHALRRLDEVVVIAALSVQVVIDAEFEGQDHLRHQSYFFENGTRKSDAFEMVQGKQIMLEVEAPSAVLDDGQRNGMTLVLKCGLDGYDPWIVTLLVFPERGITGQTNRLPER